MIPTFQLILYRLISHGPSSQQQVVSEVGTLRNTKCGRRWRSAQLNTTNQTFVCTVGWGLGWVTPWLQSIAHSEQRSKDFICDCPYDNWQCKTSCNIWNLTQNCNVCSGTRQTQNHKSLSWGNIIQQTQKHGGKVTVLGITAGNTEKWRWRSPGVWPWSCHSASLLSVLSHGTSLTCNLGRWSSS